jgi:UDP-N-acetylmuramoyl-tripeptide--D-alanyl-D-alanine ligase
MKGAAGAFHEKDKIPGLDIPPNLLLVEVDNSLDAMQRLASVYRNRFELPVIAITGSSGKTTKKDFTDGVL